MADSNEEWIRRRAYELWEAEGYPTGKDAEHWEQAKLEYVTLKPASSVSGKSRREAKGVAEAAAETKTASAKPTAAKTPASKTSTAKAAGSKPTKPVDLAGAAKTNSPKPNSSKAAAAKTAPVKTSAAKASQDPSSSVQEPVKKRSKKVAAGG